MKSTIIGLTLLAVLFAGFPSRFLAQERVVSGPGFDPTPVAIGPVPRTAPRPITSMDLLTLRDLRGSSISPDGRSVAFAAIQAVYETNSYRTGLFVVGTEPNSVPVSLGTAGPPRWDIIGQQRSYPLTWSPDGRYVLSVMKSNGGWQIWRWKREGGPPQQMTHNEHDVESYEWSPNTNSIVFTVAKPMEVTTAKKLLESGVVYDGSFRAWGEETFPQLFLGSKPKATETWIYDWASGTERKATSEEESKFKKSRTVPGLDPGDFVRSKVSPDGTQLASSVQRVHGEDAYKHVIVVNRPGVDKPLQLTKPSRDYIYDIWWSGDSSEIYFNQVSDNGSALYAVPAKGGPVRKISNSTNLLSGFSFDHDGRIAVCSSYNTTTPHQLAVVDLKTGETRPLVDLNPEFQNITLSTPIKLEWTNKYGEKNYAHLLKPLNYEPGKKYPLIVTTYTTGGFLRGAAGDEYPIQVFAANGFAVLDFGEPNRAVSVRGDFEETKKIWESPMDSLTLALKTLDEMGIILPDKRGLSGLSFGTELTLYTISHSDLFQVAATSGGGGRDPFFYHIAETGFRNLLANQWGIGLPYGRTEANWREISPALNIERIHAPVLEQVADSEMIPALMFYNTLRDFKKPVEMVVYSDEKHVKNQPKHRYEVYERNLDWFNFWLQGKESSDPAKAEQYKRWRELKALQANNGESIAGSPR